MDTIFQTTFCQRYVFPEVPAPHIRRKLIEAGFKFDGVCWHRTLGTASTLSNAEMMHFLDEDCRNIRESGIAQSSVVL